MDDEPVYTTCPPEAAANVVRARLEPMCKWSTLQGQGPCMQLALHLGHLQSPAIDDSLYRGSHTSQLTDPQLRRLRLAQHHTLRAVYSALLRNLW